MHLPCFLESQTVLNLITLALAFATVWLAVTTARMAKATQQMAATEHQPLVMFKNVDLHLNMLSDDTGVFKEASVRVALRFANVGKVLVRYKLVSVKATFEGRTVEEPKFTTTTGLIYPGETITFNYAPIEHVTTIPGMMTGVAEYEMSYWRNGSDEIKTKRDKIRYSSPAPLPGASSTTEFIYLEEPYDDA